LSLKLPNLTADISWSWRTSDSTNDDDDISTQIIFPLECVAEIVEITCVIQDASHSKHLRDMITKTSFFSFLQLQLSQHNYNLKTMPTPPYIKQNNKNRFKKQMNYYMTWMKPRAKIQILKTNMQNHIWTNQAMCPINSQYKCE
jgi:hypothetical protein